MKLYLQFVPSFKLLITLFFLFIYPLNNSLAEIRYVSKTGTSIPPFLSWETASDSIQKCIDISNSGDTIYVANGEYKEKVVMIPGLSLIGAGMDSCIINASEFSLPIAVTMNDTCYLTGFQLKAKLNVGAGIYIRNINIQYLSVLVEHNKIKDAQTGIVISSSSLSVDNDSKIISKNILLNVEDGIVSANTKPLIKDNLIYARDNGLYSQVISSPTYLNNIVVFEQNGGMGFHDFGNRSILKNNLFIILDGKTGYFGMFTYSDSLINNVVYGYFETGILTSGSTIINNSLTYSEDGLWYDVGGGTPPIVHYNNIWHNGRNYVNFTPDSTNISEDPMFVNPDSLDFHLQMFSPLIDAGDPDILDKDGTRSDIGLFGGPYGESYTYQDLAPRAPVNLYCVFDTNNIFLKWNRNTESDLSGYKIYRDTTADFTIDSTKLISTQEDSFFIQITPAGVNALYYKITAFDNQGNESQPSEEVSVILSSVNNNEPITVYDYILYQNYPNPFNPSTKISYQLKERGYVKLYVYDIKGELVQTLVNETKEGGYYEVEFSPGSSNDEQMSLVDRFASGIYIYQIMVRGENNIPLFTDSKKMICLK